MQKIPEFALLNAFQSYLRKGRRERVASALRDCPGLANAQLPSGERPLSLALNEALDNEIIKLLLESGATVLENGLNDHSIIVDVMICACEERDRRPLVALLESGLSSNFVMRPNGLTLLMRSSFSSLETTELLIKHDADPNRSDDGGWTAIMYACALDSASGALGELDTYSIVDLLIKSGARLQVRNREGLSAVDILRRQSVSPNLVGSLIERIEKQENV